MTRKDAELRANDPHKNRAGQSAVGAARRRGAGGAGHRCGHGGRLGVRAPWRGGARAAGMHAGAVAGAGRCDLYLGRSRGRRRLGEERWAVGAVRWLGVQGPAAQRNGVSAWSPGARHALCLAQRAASLNQK